MFVARILRDPSPCRENRRRDHVEKRAEYAPAGIAERWSCFRKVRRMNSTPRPERFDATDDEDPWLEWYSLTPQQRWEETTKAWQFYRQVGGTLDPEPDSQSPFDAVMPRGQAPAYGGAGVRVLRRGRV